MLMSHICTGTDADLTNQKMTFLQQLICFMCCQHKYRQTRGFPVRSSHLMPIKVMQRPDRWLLG